MRANRLFLMYIVVLATVTVAWAYESQQHAESKEESWVSFDSGDKDADEYLSLKSVSSHTDVEDGKISHLNSDSGDDKKSDSDDDKKSNSDDDKKSNSDDDKTSDSDDDKTSDSDDSKTSSSDTDSEPTPKRTATKSPTPSPSKSKSPSPTPTRTRSPSPAPTKSASPSPSKSSSPIPRTSSPTPVVTPVPTQPSCSRCIYVDALDECAGEIRSVLAIADDDAASTVRCRVEESICEVNPVCSEVNGKIVCSCSNELCYIYALGCSS